MVQVAAAAAAASEMLGRALAISTALEAEEHLREIQAELRDQEEQANDAVKVCLAWVCHWACAQHGWLWSEWQQQANDAVKVRLA